MSGYNMKTARGTEHCEIVEGLDCKKKQIEKHVELDNAICELDDVERAISRLLDDVCCNPAADEDSSEERLKPSLRGVLDGGPVRIRDRCVSICKIINEVRTVLFGD